MNLLKLLKLKCLACHEFRLEKRQLKIYAVKFHLLDCGKLKEALRLDDDLACVIKNSKSLASSMEEKSTSSPYNNKKSKREQDVMHVGRSIDEYLESKLSDADFQSEVILTSHERNVRRLLVKEFMKECNSCKKCANCNAISPKLRQDSYNKIFQIELSQLSKKLNRAERIRFRSAILTKSLSEEGGDGEATGYDSEMSDIEDDDNVEPTGVSTMSDDDDDEDDAFGGKRKRSSAVSNSNESSEKPNQNRDKFMHALEVEAQVQLTWRLQPFICSKIFGCAHDIASGWSIFFMRAIPVAPSRFRPPMIMGTMSVEHAQNVYLNKILDLNDRLRRMLATLQGVDNHNSIERDLDKENVQARSITTWIDMQTQVNCYIDSSKDPSRNANAPSGIRQLLEKKEGIFRKHMMGKRVNFACRSVISPDPYIGTNEIGIPLYFAKTLTYSTPVTNLNVSEMRRLVIRGPNQYPGACWVKLANGRRIDLAKMQQLKREAIAARLNSGEGIAYVGRQLRDGDMVLMNRQPSLHKPSIMAHYVRVLHSPTQKTIRMHYANCNTYNADYDGDEMNCHFPQNDIARAESECIVKTDLQYIVPTDGSPLRGLIQDHVDAGVKMTSKSTFLKRWEYQQLVYASLSSLSGLELIQSDADIEMVPPAIRKPQELWTGKQVVSTLLQHLRKGKDGDPSSNHILPGISVDLKAKTPNFAFGEWSEEHLVIIRDGELLRGILDKSAYGASDFSLVHGVYEAYGPTKAGLLLNAFGRLFTAYLQYYSGHSCRMEDLILTPDTDEKRRELVQKTYNMGSRAAKAWADSDGGKIEIPSLSDNKNADKPLKPVEAAATAAKIAQLLSGEEGKENAALLDSYMQSNLNPLASQIIKVCLPNGLAVPFPANTFSLMVITGAKGSTVNQSQVSCALGQQALEGRRVPRMSSGRTLPSFAPFDPNPRADGFIADRFLTGVRPQEYYFHCMAGREGLVDTAVKTSRSGYLQRCLVKHLEELKVCYDHTVRDAEGSIVQFLYGEDGIDPMKAAHLDGSSSTLQFIARNNNALIHRHIGLPQCSLDIAAADCKRSEDIQNKEMDLLTKGSFIQARKLRVGNEWRRGALCRGWFSAFIIKVHPDGEHFDIRYTKDGSVANQVPHQVVLDYAGSRNIPALSKVCTIIQPAVPDPILSDTSKERGNHRIGVSGSCVSEKVAKSAVKAIEHDLALQNAISSTGLSSKDFKRAVAAKYCSALCAPGEAVGCIAAQSIGEPSTQMTLNTFHLAGAGANVTLGIPRLREIIMTASKTLKTPTMSVPLHSFVSEKESIRLTRYFTRLDMMELISSHSGIRVTESLRQNSEGLWERAYQVTLRLHSSERIKEAFGLTLEDVATVVAGNFIPNLSKIMKMELKRSHGDLAKSFHVSGGESSSFDYTARNTGEKMRSEDDDDDDDYAAGEEDGVTASRYSHKKEMASYGEMDDDEKVLISKAQADEEDDDEENDDQQPRTVTDDEYGSDDEKNDYNQSNSVRINHSTDSLILQPLRVDPSARPLLMVGLVERAAAATVVRARPKIEKAFVNQEEGRGKCLQTAGCNFEEMWLLDQVDHNHLLSNDIWAIRCAYGVEAARKNIADQIRGVFAVYGISVDPRHLSLIADYMTYDGDYKAMNRGGMADVGSSFLQMSFETTANFMVDAALNNRVEEVCSPSANIVVGRPVQHGTGMFECVMRA
jgi:DNA-directed RNA polymerase I subunit RPA1